MSYELSSDGHGQASGLTTTTPVSDDSPYEAPGVRGSISRMDAIKTESWPFPGVKIDQSVNYLVFWINQRRVMAPKEFNIQLPEAKLHRLERVSPSEVTHLRLGTSLTQQGLLSQIGHPKSHCPRDIGTSANFEVITRVTKQFKVTFSCEGPRTSRKSSKSMEGVDCTERGLGILFFTNFPLTKPLRLRAKSSKLSAKQLYLSLFTLKGAASIISVRN